MYFLVWQPIMWPWELYVGVLMWDGQRQYLLSKAILLSWFPVSSSAEPRYLRKKTLSLFSFDGLPLKLNWSQISLHMGQAEWLKWGALWFCSCGCWWPVLLLVWLPRSPHLPFQVSWIFANLGQRYQQQLQLKPEAYRHPGKQTLDSFTDIRIHMLNSKESDFTSLN